MAVEPYVKQIWDTSSYVNPTRMNHIEDGIESASVALENLNFSKQSTGTTSGSYGFFSISFSIGSTNYYDVPILGIHIQGDSGLGNRDTYIGQVVSGGLAGRFVAVSPVGVVMINPN